MERTTYANQPAKKPAYYPATRLLQSVPIAFRGAAAAIAALQTKTYLYEIATETCKPVRDLA